MFLLIIVLGVENLSFKIIKEFKYLDDFACEFFEFLDFQGKGCFVRHKTISDDSEYRQVNILFVSYHLMFAFCKVFDKFLHIAKEQLEIRNLPNDFMG